jgi:hypothetical protein
MVLSVVASALLLWMLVVSLFLMLWSRRMLRRDVHGWLRRRGLTCPEDVEAKVLWLHGGVGGFFNIGNKIGRFGYLNAPFTAAAVTPSWFLVESQWPLVLWRRRLVIPAGTTLRQIDGRIADPMRRCLVSSVPPEHLVWVLRSCGWDLKEVPF